MSYWLFVLAFFCSPLYFVIRRKWLAFTVNALFYGTALITVLLFPLPILFWMIGVLHASWDLGMNLREQAMKRQAELIAEKMGEKLKAQTQKDGNA